MTLKKKHTIVRFDDPSAPGLEENLSNLYRDKLESRTLLNSSTQVQILPFQSIEHGVINTSANGSPTMVFTRGLTEKLNTVVYAIVSVDNVNLYATVTDLTQSEVQLTVRHSVIGTDISSTTSDTFTLRYQVIGSNP